jgi:hypothetical protein
MTFHRQKKSKSLSLKSITLTISNRIGLETLGECCLKLLTIQRIENAMVSILIDSLERRNLNLSLLF